MKYVALTLMAFLMLASPVRADQPLFFSALSDVPAMPGLYEAPDHHMIFDVPEGRIIDLAVVADGVTRAAIENYYAQALPQFGWRPVRKNRFTRGSEQLELLFENQNLLKISVSPL